MSKLSRFFVLIVFIGVALWFLYPSIEWYFIMSQKDKDLLTLSQDQLDIQPPEIKKRALQVKNVRKGALSLGLDLQGGVNITLQINEESLSNQLLEKYEFDTNKLSANYENEFLSASDRALEVLKNRMDQFGVAEPIIRKTFDHRITIELPGLNNPQLIKEALSRVGRLEFKLVDEKSMKKLSELNVQMPRGYVLSRQDVPQDFQIPAESEWASYWENDEFGIPKLKGWYILYKKVELDGTMISTARPDHDQYGRNYIAFELTPEGTDIFAEVTGQNIKNRLAIVLDGKVKSAPSIQSEIAGGSGQITGDFTVEEAAFLANVLKAGSLPVKLDIVQERIIGASLGEDSIKDGTKAALIGAIIVVVFMIAYYKLSGLFSIISLAFNMLFLVALLAGVRATLTLSGIAGIALTVGMAVDANVIIYERIREELRRSKNYRHALENGFQHASATIWDANITTIIAAFTLYIFGSGTIKGFGITLAFGIIANIFAALFICRLIFDWWLDTFHPEKISV